MKSSWKVSGRNPGVFSTIDYRLLLMFPTSLDEYNVRVPHPGSLATLYTGDTGGSSLSDSYLSLEKTQHASRDSAARLGVLALRRARRRGSRARFERRRRIHRNSQTQGNWRGDKPALSG